MIKRLIVCALTSALFAINFSLSAQNEQATDPQTTSSNEPQSSMSNDFTLPVTLVSNDQFLDGKKKSSVFVDNVVIRQGSLKILADRVEADASAGKGKEVIIASGKPASYQQRLEDGSTVIASANEIIYKVEFQTISLKGDAVISQNEVKVNGDSIAFDMAKEQIMASTNEDSKVGVTTVLSPGAFSLEETQQPDNTNEDKP